MFHFLYSLISVTTATEDNVPSVICHVKHVWDRGEINASLVQEAGNWQPANAIPNAQKVSSNPISVVKSVIIIVARVKV